MKKSRLNHCALSSYDNDSVLQNDSHQVSHITIEDVFEVIPDLLFVLDRDYRIVEFQAGRHADLYVKPDVFMQQSMLEVLPADVANTLNQALTQTQQSGQIVIIEYQLTIGAEEKWFEARLSVTKHKLFVILVRDITDEKRNEQQILYQANHDHLTGAYNRTFVFEYLAQRLKEAGRNAQHWAVLYIDLDDFKQINDQLGHSAGDTVLQQTVMAIKSSIRDEDIVARIGGDEFVVVLNVSASATTLNRIAEKLLKAIEQPVDIGETQVSISASIGVSELDSMSHLSLHEVLMRADAAMYFAKHHGKHGCAFYESLSSAEQEAARKR